MSFKSKIDVFFKYAEDVIYAVVGLVLIFGALFLLFHSIQAIFADLAGQDFVGTALSIIERMLLVLMIIEILYTVRVSLQTHTLCAEPFLIIGLIAAVRRILVISVESAYILEKFKYHMIELGILGGLVIIFVFSIWLQKRDRRADD